MQAEGENIIIHHLNTEGKQLCKCNFHSLLSVLDRIGGSPFFCRSFSRSRARLSLEYDRDDFLLRSLERERDLLRCLRLREPERDLDLLLLGDLQREIIKIFIICCNTTGPLTGA